MNRLAAGTAIALAALAIDGSLLREVVAAETGKLPAALSSSTPAASGHRSERVLSLILALEALRAAPEVLAPNGR
jgi:hypothetical protein